MKMEKVFATEAVDDAIILIRQMGVSAFPVLRDKTSEFVYMDTYIFVVDSINYGREFHGHNVVSAISSFG